MYVGIFSLKWVSKTQLSTALLLSGAAPFQYLYFLRCDNFILFFWIWRLGAHYRSGNAAGTEQDFRVERIVDHESYGRPRGLAHDISLLKLSEPAQMTRAVGMACLPAYSNDLTEIDGKNCWVTGKVSNTLKLFEPMESDRLQVIRVLRTVVGGDWRFDNLVEIYFLGFN